MKYTLSTLMIVWDLRDVLMVKKCQLDILNHDVIMMSSENNFLNEFWFSQIYYYSSFWIRYGHIHQNSTIFWTFDTNFMWPVILKLNRTHLDVVDLSETDFKWEWFHFKAQPKFEDVKFILKFWSRIRL